MDYDFVKMHGLGNDFVVVDARERPFHPRPADAVFLADRRRGIGCDQLIVLEPSARADAFMRIYNPDGSESGACGNATRCVGALLGGEASIETAAGVLSASTVGTDVAVGMGRAEFAWERVPLAFACDTLRVPVAWDGLVDGTALSMGNPHIVFVVADVDAVPLERVGPVVETDALFPERVNVSVVQVESRGRVKMRVWERGAGLTLACGSGACAVAAAMVARRLTDRSVAVEMPGGALRIDVADDWNVRMTGAVATSFRGTFRI